MKRTPADLLKEARSKRYPTAKAAAAAHGWNAVTYRAHESGMRNIPPKIAKTYARAFGINAGDLVGIAAGGYSPPINAVTNVPLVARVSAGAFRADEGLGLEGIPVPAVPHASVPAEAQYAVLIDGPSVNKRIADGAYAICAPYDQYPGGPKHGQLVHVVRERAGLYEHTIKELHYTREGPILMPCSTDPRYQEQIAIEAPEDDAVVRIHGVVIGIFQAL